MPDFPDNTQDPSSEEEAASKRALTLGLVTAGLGILAQPRFRGEPATIPIARGALGGVEAYEGAQEEAGKDAEERRKFNIEQGRLDQQTRYQDMEVKDRQRGLDIQQQNADELTKSRQATEQANGPVGEAGLQMLAPYAKDPSTALFLKSMNPDDLKAMPYARFQNLMDRLNITYNQAHNPSFGMMPVVTDGPKNPDGTPGPPTVHVYSYNKKSGGTPTEVLSGTEAFKEKAPTEAEYRRLAVEAGHPEYKGHPDMIQKLVDAEKLDNASQLQLDKLKNTDEFKAKDEARQNQARQELATFTHGLKSREDVLKATIKPPTGYSASVGINPVTHAPAMQFKPTGFAPLSKSYYVDLPTDIPGGIPSALTPPGRPVNVSPDTLASYSKSFGDRAFQVRGKTYKIMGGQMIDVTNPPPGAAKPTAPQLAPAPGAPAAPDTAPAKPAAAPSVASGLAPAPLAATPLRASAPVAPVAAAVAAPAAPAVAARPEGETPPVLYRDKGGKPLYNAKTGDYLFKDSKGRLYVAKSEEGPWIPYRPPER